MECKVDPYRNQTTVERLDALLAWSSALQSVVVASVTEVRQCLAGADGLPWGDDSRRTMARLAVREIGAKLDEVSCALDGVRFALQDDYVEPSRDTKGEGDGRR